MLGWAALRTNFSSGLVRRGAERVAAGGWFLRGFGGFGPWRWRSGCTALPTHGAARRSSFVRPPASASLAAASRRYGYLLPNLDPLMRARLIRSPAILSPDSSISPFSCSGCVSCGSRFVSYSDHFSIFLQNYIRTIFTEFWRIL